ncbi:MAG: single-stranded DNA-binding protein [Desulfobacula sp.]|nr:single-stranded DNA-binding protein [Desulfobacula sp.]
MAGLNKVMLIGRLGRDPEIRYSQQGVAVVNFSIATSEQWTDKNTGQKQERTEWHNIVSFGKQAEILEKYLSKGRQVYIEGSLQTDTYDKDGQTHYSTKIKVFNFQFLGDRQDNQSGGHQQQGGGGQPQGEGRQGGYQQNNAQANNQYQQQPTNPGTTGSGSDPIPDDDIPF